VREKLIIFPYGQYVVGIYVSLAFRRFSQVRGRCWVLRLPNMTVGIAAIEAVGDVVVNSESERGEARRRTDEG